MYKLAYSFTIELHDSLYYATREIGKLFETGFYLHNYALSYALGFVTDSYFCRQQIPKYEEHLSQLNMKGIYVLPSLPNFNTMSRETYTWAYERQERYHKRQLSQNDTAINLPLIGRALTISAGTQFTSIVLSKKPLILPHWIRLGKWASKAEIINIVAHEIIAKKGSAICSFPLNPLDVLPKVTTLSYSVRNMPPTSLITDLHFSGDFFQIPLSEQTVTIPVKQEYLF